MKIFTIIGYTNSGKTRTIVEVIKELVRREKIVNSIKHVHIEDFSIDTEGKDSWLHKEAGAVVTGIRADNETSLIFSRKLSVKEIAKRLNCDYLALEGFSNEKNIPKVLCAKNIQDLKEKLDKSVFAISGVIANDISEYDGLPVLNSLNNIQKLVDLIEKKAINYQDFLKID